jgi:hypothetical protein
VLLFLFTLAMISKLNVATKILKVASQAVMVRRVICLTQSDQDRDSR